MSAIELCEHLLDELTIVVPTMPRVHPGFALLEEKLGSLPLGTTLAVLASTNVGKSSYVLEMLLRAAQRSVSTGYLSVEDHEPVVRARLAGMVSGISSRKILQNRVSRHEVAAVAHGLGELERLKDRLSVSILQGGTESDACAAMSELAARGARIIAVDYLQKIASSPTYGSKVHEMSAMKLNECPSKHDMKESGDLENMVDAIVGIWREYEDDFAPIWARLLKVKWGGVGVSWRLERDDGPVGSTRWRGAIWRLLRTHVGSGPIGERQGWHADKEDGQRSDHKRRGVSQRSRACSTCALL